MTRRYVQYVEQSQQADAPQSGQNQDAGQQGQLDQSATQQQSGDAATQVQVVEQQGTVDQYAGQTQEGGDGAAQSQAVVQENAAGQSSAQDQSTGQGGSQGRGSSQASQSSQGVERTQQSAGTQGAQGTDQSQSSQQTGATEQSSAQQQQAGHGSTQYESSAQSNAGVQYADQLTAERSSSHRAEAWSYGGQLSHQRQAATDGAAQEARSSQTLASEQWTETRDLPGGGAIATAVHISDVLMTSSQTQLAGIEPEPSPPAGGGGPSGPGSDESTGSNPRGAGAESTPPAFETTAPSAAERLLEVIKGVLAQIERLAGALIALIQIDQLLATGLATAAAALATALAPRVPSREEPGAADSPLAPSANWFPREWLELDGSGVADPRSGSLAEPLGEGVASGGRRAATDVAALTVLDAVSVLDAARTLSGERSTGHGSSHHRRRSALPIPSLPEDTSDLPTAGGLSSASSLVLSGSLLLLVSATSIAAPGLTRRPRSAAFRRPLVIVSPPDRPG